METERQLSTKSVEDNYRRDSFSDRVCDDLCQHILQYLSLKDRLRLECVSKQFQRTIFLSKCSLEISKLPRHFQSLEVVESYLKKFPNLKIFIGFVFDFFGKQNDLIELIIKYCNHLTHIRLITYNVIEEEVQKKFFDKFGHKLISFGIRSEKSWNTYEINIEELTVTPFVSQLSQIKFNRLKRFYVSNLLPKDLNSFELFIENNAKTLKHLDISYELYYYQEFGKYLKIICKAINLVHLSIVCQYERSNKTLANNWKEIAINCKQIKSLRFRYFDSNTMGISDKKVFEELNHFNGLKRLNLVIEQEPYYSHHFRIFEDLKGLNRLTHLKIHFVNSAKCMAEWHMKDIDIDFPKLKSLKINPWLSATECTAQVLSRLSSLETIELNIHNGQTIPVIEERLVQNCKHLKSFKLIEYRAPDCDTRVPSYYPRYLGNKYRIGESSTSSQTY